MHIVITGANGFVGKALSARLQRDGHLGGRSISALTLLDTGFVSQPSASFVEQQVGSIADPGVVKGAFERAVDVVVHLASIPGGTAEQQYELGRDVNLQGTTFLLEQARLQTECGGVAPVFVFASTIAVFGYPMPEIVDDDTPLQPQMTYGTQKLIGEMLVADFTRRGWVDGRSLRLPGVLARPPARTGQLSAFMSDIIRELAAGRRFTCPTSERATTWASSIGNIVDNLLHASVVDGSRLPIRRSLTLPTQSFTFGQLVDAIAQVHGSNRRELVTWAPDERIESLFGRFPPLMTPAADAAGFRHDGDLPTLVRRALELD
jgi:nucleoside-diphosphate-sugar epimerase